MTPSDNTGGDSPEMSADGESLAQQNGNVLRKGPWTKEEDEILVKFVQEKGIVKWSSIGKQTGLARSGKSCRLRWLNHLRPNLKKGSFTKEEVNLIVKLHSEYGNKWTRIASKDGSSRNDTTVSEKSEGVLGEESLKREVNKATLMEGSKNCDILVEGTREKDIVDTGSKVGLSSEQYKFTKCLNMEDSLLVQGFNVGGEFIEEPRKDLLEECSREGQLIESSSKDEFVIGESSCMGDQLIKIMEQHDVTDANKANQVSNQRHTSLLLESGGRDINSCSIKHSAEHIEAEDHIGPEISSILDYFPMTAEIPEWYNTSQEISNSKTAL